MNNTSVSSDSGIYRVGDIVVGSSDPGKSVYSASGTRLIDDGVFLYGSDAALAGQGKELINSAIRSGGIPLSVKKSENTTSVKKSSKKKLTAPSSPKQFSAENYLAQFENFSSRTEMGNYAKVDNSKTVQFENSFGRMKAKVEHIIEEELAYMLIFKDEDSVVFEPKIGETLTLHTPSKEQVAVYYPGVTFAAPESKNRMMILFKVPFEE
jgi:hypothetical protein